MIIAITDYSKSLIRDVRVKEIRKVSNFAFPKVYILQKSFQICKSHKSAKLQINHFESFGNVNNLIKSIDFNMACIQRFVKVFKHLLKKRNF